jgi:hypothetical protein
METHAASNIKNLKLQIVMFARGNDCGAKKQVLFIQEARQTFKVIPITNQGAIFVVPSTSLRTGSSSAPQRTICTPLSLQSSPP